MGKHKNLYLIIGLIIMILVFNIGIQTGKNVSKSDISQDYVQEHVQNLENKICEFVETTYYYWDNSVEKPTVHFGRVIGVLAILTIAYLICIFLAMKIGIFFIKTKKVQKQDSNYSLQGVRQ